MTIYRALRNYRGRRASDSWLFYTGDKVELSDKDARHINTDAPGTLGKEKPVAKVEK